eukprot:840520-Ditylum_brightwellii.AAC.1
MRAAAREWRILLHSYSPKKYFKIEIWAEKDMSKDVFLEFAWPITKERKKKKSTGLPPLDIPEPGWLADPTHWTK